MKTFRTIAFQKKLLIFSLICLGFTFGAQGQNEVKNRLVIAINNISYSQRHVELYLTLREALRAGATNAPVLAIDQKNWKEALDAFSDEMMILQEQQRITTYQPSTEAIQKALDRVDKRRDENAQFASDLKRIGADPASIRRTVSQILSVNFYQQTRGKQLGLKEQDKTKEVGPSKIDWMVELREKSVVRFFKDALTYIPVRS